MSSATLNPIAGLLAELCSAGIQSFEDRPSLRPMWRVRILPPTQPDRRGIRWFVADYYQNDDPESRFVVHGWQRSTGRLHVVGYPHALCAHGAQRIAASLAAGHLVTDTRLGGEGDRWTHWAVINRRAFTRTEVRALLRALTRPVGPVIPGRQFYRAPQIRRQGSRILFRQTGGADV